MLITGAEHRGWGTHELEAVVSLYLYKIPTERVFGVSGGSHGIASTKQGIYHYVAFDPLQVIIAFGNRATG